MAAHDIGWNLIPRMVGSGRAYAYPFNGYWEQFTTLEAYWRANLALLEEGSTHDLGDRQGMIHTWDGERPPIKVGPSGQVNNSRVSDGCVIDGEVVHSVLSPGMRVEKTSASILTAAPVRAIFKQALREGVCHVLFRNHFSSGHSTHRHFTLVAGG
jgi:ADP-glucose pyrophosphorylase